MPTHALHFTVDQFHLESQFGFTKSEVCVELSNLKDVRKTETKKQTNRNTVTKYIKHHYVSKRSELISLESYSFSIFRQFCSLLKNKGKKNKVNIQHLLWIMMELLKNYLQTFGILLAWNLKRFLLCRPFKILKSHCFSSWNLKLFRQLLNEMNDICVCDGIALHLTMETNRSSTVQNGYILSIRRFLSIDSSFCRNFLQPFDL